MDTEKKERNAGLDLLKMIAILMVLTLHVPLWEYSTLKQPFPVLEYAFRLLSEGVPVFLMINGMLILPRKKLNVRKHYRKTLELFLVMLAWEAIYIGLTHGKASLNGLFSYIFQTGVGSPYTGVFWFLQGLIALYLAYPLLNAVYTEHYDLFFWAFLTVLLFRIGNNASQLTADLAAASGHDGTALPLAAGWLQKFQIVPIGEGKADYLLFFMFGGVIQNNLEKVRENRRGLILTGMLCWAGAFAYGLWRSHLQGNVFNPAFNYCSVFTLPILAGWIALADGYKDRGRWYNRFVTSVGKNTMGIYVSHLLLIAAIGHVVSITSLGFAARAGITAGVFFVCWALSVAARKIPVVGRLFAV